MNSQLASYLSIAYCRNTRQYCRPVLYLGHNHLIILTASNQIYSRFYSEEIDNFRQALWDLCQPKITTTNCRWCKVTLTFLPWLRTSKHCRNKQSYEVTLKPWILFGTCRITNQRNSLPSPSTSLASPTNVWVLKRQRTRTTVQSSILCAQRQSTSWLY